MPRQAIPNSKYSQRKARREFQERYANMTPEERAKIDNPTTLIMILVAVFFSRFYSEVRRGFPVQQNGLVGEKALGPIFLSISLFESIPSISVNSKS